MSKLEVLSVAEAGYISDSITAKQTNTRYIFGVGTDNETLKISLGVKRKIEILKLRNGVPIANIEFNNVDLDGLIEYLNEVKIFIAEEEMVERLKGR